MSYGPEPTDKELEQMQALGGWRWLAAYPCFVVLALVQIARRRWAEWWGR